MTISSYAFISSALAYDMLRITCVLGIIEVEDWLYADQFVLEIVRERG